MDLLPLDTVDRELIAAACEVLRRNYTPERHTVGAAVRCASGRVYAGVNVEACGYGPCAEPIAVGTALSNGEKQIVAIVAVTRRGDEYVVISPCGNCRQLLVDYSPKAMVMIPDGDQVVKTSAINLLPHSYLSSFDET